MSEVERRGALYERLLPVRKATAGSRSSVRLSEVGRPRTTEKSSRTAEDTSWGGGEKLEEHRGVLSSRGISRTRHK